MIIIKEIDKKIECYETYLNRISDELTKMKKLVPEKVMLRAVKHRNEYQYFIRKVGSDGNGIYIKKEELNKAKVLAQIEYNEKLILLLKDSIINLKKIKEEWIENPFVNAKEKLNLAKRELINMPVVTDEIYIQQWKEQEYKGVSFTDDYPEYYTRQGLRVRSKSEVIIADILDETGIPFLYEKPLKTKTGVTHPDFTVLDISKRREIYWEHFGMMDDIDYRNNAFLKMKKYEESGLYQHDCMIWTFETSKYPINTKEIRRMITGLKEMLGYY
ncbi:MAG: hypothetical protein IJ224_06055 [Lachnospiraceae bacterium]|nr:hypothetical protein [Lachnospiraceae bacterium]